MNIALAITTALTLAEKILPAVNRLIEIGRQSGELSKAQIEEFEKRKDAMFKSEHWKTDEDLDPDLEG